MSLNQTEQTINDAITLYDEQPPSYVGQFGLSKASAGSLPINLEEAYAAMFETLSAEPAQAMAFARTFGKLSVNVMLDGSSTTFNLKPATTYPPANMAQIATSKRYQLGELFGYPDVDAPCTYLLCKDQPLTAELGIIQALHIVDYAIVSGQYDGKLPNVQLIGVDALLELQAQHPDIFIRTYGNVRGLADAMKIIGTAVPTKLLEKSALSTESLSTNLPPALGDTLTQSQTNGADQSPGRQSAGLVGITSAKKPHIGHAMLIAKALTEVRDGQPVIVELNDHGPRVGKAITHLAITNSMTTEATMTDVIAGEFDVDAVQAAYVARGEVKPAELPADFALTANNRAYQTLLSAIEPAPGTLLPLANSDPQMRGLYKKLLANPMALALFDGAGMTMLGDETNNVVVEKEGTLTSAGILASLAVRYSLTMFDSPAPLLPTEVAAFEAAGLGINLQPGIGVSIGFESASGTNGKAPTLDSLNTEYLQNPRDLLYVTKLLLEDAVYVKSETGSYTPNYASADSILQAFEHALATLSTIPAKDELLASPIHLKPITAAIARDFLAEAYSTFPTKGKIKAGEVAALTALLPSLCETLSPDLIAAVNDVTDPSMTVPKAFLSQQDNNTIQRLRSSNSKEFFAQLTASYSYDPTATASIVFNEQSPTLLAQILKKMGYNTDNMREGINGIVNKGEVYVPA